MWAVLLFIAAAGATSTDEPSVDSRPSTPGKKCPTNEIWVKCPIDCPSEYCSKHFNKIKCPPPSCAPPGCRCKEGYLRDDNTNQCVPADKCPPQCGYNEKLVKCRTICPPQNCDLPYTDYYCTEESKICEQGCDCIEDHFRNSSGICVPSDQCSPPPQCGYNEKLVECRTICPPQSCDLPYTEYYCTEESKICEQGCDCIEDHFRNSSGICVPSDQCPPPTPQCGYNEKLVECRTICPPQSCDLPYTDYYCTEESKICEQGCDCIEDHFRNSSGICVPSDQCPPPAICGPNEQWSKCMACPRRVCHTSYVDDCCDPEECQAGCECIEGHARNASGECVALIDCANTNPSECGINEYLDPCKRTCPPQVCEALYLNYLCAAPDPDAKCEPGCMCKDGHLRDESDTCIPVEDCPPPPWLIVEPVDPVCPENEVYTNCTSTCPECCPCTDVPDCKSGCQCKEGYVRDADENCVPAQKCGVNEELVSCFRSCPPDSCDTLYLNYPCANPENLPCYPGCKCKQGYLRDNGTCVPVEKCPPLNPPDPICSENETYDDCVPYCPPGLFCPAVLTPGCEPGCKCNEGYVRNDNGVCELSPECGANEEVVSCYRSCPPDTCDTLYLAYDCANPENLPCYPGCKCKQGYLRNNGTCIPEKKCPPLYTAEQGCSENEFYDNCVPYCPPGRSCPDVLTPGCEPGCKCKDGYEKNESGVCDLPPGPPTCPSNEFYESCVPYCPPGNSCATVLKPGCNPGCKCNKGYKRNKDGACTAIPSSSAVASTSTACDANEVYRSCVPECPQDYEKPCPTTPLPNCKPGCQCKEGYKRDKDGICSPSPSPKPPTPTPPTCPDNEYYYNCVPYCPPGRACSQAIDPGCEPGCRCKEGLERNQKGVCSEKPKPPSPPACPENEYYYNCVPYCPPGRACIQALEPNCEPGCRCKQGYERNGTDCVASKKPPSPPTCPVNEYYYNCVPYCPPGRACIQALEPNCEPGCRCNQGLERNQKGICSKKPKPPTPPTCPENEYYYSCVPYCPPGYACIQALEPGCEPGCRCKEGYERNGTDCVPSKKPPGPPTCPANEYYYNCVPYCPPKHACPDVLEPGCEPGCRCKEGYERNGSGDCAPKPPTCPPNEFYDNCEQYCPPDMACAAYVRDCTPGCVCNLGYERNENGTCVKPTPTPDTCNANETYVQCAFDCPTIFCPTNEYSSMIACSPPYPCPAGCVCKGENVRRRSRENRTCVAIEECPAVNCSKPHEIWDYCPSSCLAESCEDANKPETVCFEKRRYCQPKCVCEKGHYRNSSGICVPASECSQNACGANEIFSRCAVDCGNVFCPENEYNDLIVCDPPDPCPSGCSCKANFRRLSEKNRTCIPEKECPPVKCSKANEIWDYCPSACLAEKCEDMNKPASECTEERPYCRPKCVCDKGFYRNSNGTCVPAEECPKPKCEGNQTEVYCPTFKCPNRFCPVGDDLTQIACKPPRDCPSGCGCGIPYRYTSETDLSCILAEDCPPQECTRPNEEWARCPQCLAESCADADTPETGVCNTLIHNCEPRCVCKKGFYRNDEQMCVPKEECSKPKCPGNQTEVYCPTFKCPHQFCPVSNDDVIYACKPPRDCASGCGCADPYKYRSKDDYSCVLAEDCPPPPPKSSDSET
ncbi:trypsin inhibitor like cysteine rich domain-containing protein [Phthorimaea operculella]|nr:trypsin inhibitor like cysteine rich domain-containing protein [Phthorimaea operculella]